MSNATSASAALTLLDNGYIASVVVWTGWLSFKLFFLVICRAPRSTLFPYMILCRSAHACIKRDGQVLQYVDFAQRAWHAGVSEFDGVVGCNDFSIGIELEGTDTHPYTDAQYEALSEMTRYLLSQFPMMTTDRIVGHNTIAPGRKTDPGEAFDWSRYLASLS